MSLVLPITGTFDIAVARNKMRKVAEQYNWPPAFRARASAALTVLAELVLFAHYPHANSLLLNINVLERGGQLGIEFVCDTSSSANGLFNSLSNPARSQLERASDELDFCTGNGTNQITVRVWTR